MVRERFPSYTFHQSRQLRPEGKLVHNCCDCKKAIYRGDKCCYLSDLERVYCLDCIAKTEVIA